MGCSSLIEKEVPNGGKADVVIAIVIPVVVDIETTWVEVTDIDTVAVRVKNLPIFIQTTESCLYFNRKIPFCILFGSSLLGDISAKNGQEVQSLLD